MSAKVVLLAAQTARSQAYVQTLISRNIEIDHVVLLEKSEKRKGALPYTPEACVIDDLFVPDFSIPLADSLAILQCPVSHMLTDDLRSSELRQALEDINPEVVIYSGYGGQLVPADLCTQWDFLHVHAGWLPEYRGSTTIYYSWLNEGFCGASAILLEPTIDSGPVLMRKKYAVPGLGVDPDYVFDNAIRANLLADVLAHYQENESWPQRIVQEEVDATTYYKIHPVLKNIIARNQGVA